MTNVQLNTAPQQSVFRLWAAGMLPVCLRAPRVPPGAPRAAGQRPGRPQSGGAARLPDAGGARGGMVAPQGLGTARRATARHHSNADETALGDTETGMTIFMFNCAFHELHVSSLNSFVLKIVVLNGLSARSAFMHELCHVNVIYLAERNQ